MIVSHFSNHLNRWDIFCECASELGITAQRFPNHIGIRWLTLGKLCKCIEKSWPALKMYFKSIDVCPEKLRKVFNDESDEIAIEYESVFSFFSFVLEHYNKFNMFTQV
jgi:hypothetical protein